MLCAATALLRAAAVSAAGRAGAVPDRAGDRDGVARPRHRASYTRAVPHRDGAADGDGCSGGRRLRADRPGIRDPGARGNGGASPCLLRACRAALQHLRILKLGHGAATNARAAALVDGAPERTVLKPAEKGRLCQAAFLIALFFAALLPVFFTVLLAVLLADFLAVLFTVFLAAFLVACLPVRYSPTFFDVCTTAPTAAFSLAGVTLNFFVQ